MAGQAKSDRAMSPGSMNDEERRELIARQHRALYGRDGAAPAENGKIASDGTTTPRSGVQGPAIATAAPNAASAPAGGAAARGPSPLGLNRFGTGMNHGGQGQVQGPASKNGVGAMESNGAHVSLEHQGQPPSLASGPTPAQPLQRSRANSTTSPTSNPPNFSLFDGSAQQSSRTSASSPSGSPPRQAAKFAPGSGVAPIGTRPSQVANSSLNKRSTTPLPSPLSFGFGASDESGARERHAAPVAANPPIAAVPDQNASLGWGSKGGVWGAKGSLGVQASVWG
jgi:hypothetical protein